MFTSTQPHISGRADISAKLTERFAQLASSLLMLVSKFRYKITRVRKQFAHPHFAQFVLFLELSQEFTRIRSQGGKRVCS